MIHQLLNLTRPFFVLDTETTGTDVENDRIIELGFQEWNAEGMVREWRTYINPVVPIPAHTTTVHNIDDHFIKHACRHCQALPNGPTHEGECQPLPTFKQLASSFAKGFTGCDFGGQNVRFDLRLLKKEFTRASVPWEYEGARIIDSYALEAVLYKRDLSTLHAKYVKTRCPECEGRGLANDSNSKQCEKCRGEGQIGLPHDGAHGALSDVRAAATVIGLQLQGHEELPRDLDALHALQWPGWLVADGSFRMQDGRPIINFGKHKGKTMDKVPRDYYDFILTNSFPADVKRLVAKAKMGEFPK